MKKKKPFIAGFITLAVVYNLYFGIGLFYLFLVFIPIGIVSYVIKIQDDIGEITSSDGEVIWVYITGLIYPFILAYAIIFAFIDIFNDKQ